MPCDLEGWTLEVRGPSSIYTYRITDEPPLRASGYRVFPRQETGLVLPNEMGQLRLLRPDGSLVEQHTYLFAECGASWSRTGEVWVHTCPPSPGRANCALYHRYLPLIQRSAGQ